jgi:hypothetical protein
MEEQENSADRELAASFGDLLAHREAIQILQEYRKGYQIILTRGWSAHTEEPTYRVIIYKLKPGQTAQDKPEYYEWEADGVSRSYHAALLQAHARAQKLLQNPPEA